MQKNINMWSNYATTSGLDNGVGPKLQIVFNDIPLTFGLASHTYLKISDYPGYNGSWGLNPNPFSPKLLLGISAPGKISGDKEWSISPITVSKDPLVIRQVFETIKQARNSSIPDYTLYGPNTYHCYSWRNQILIDAGFPIQSWGDE